MKQTTPAFKVTSLLVAESAVRTGQATHVISLGTMIPQDIQAQHPNTEILEIIDPFGMSTDTPTADRFRRDVEDALEMTQRVWKDGGEIWFHCHGGHTRSPNFALMMVIAFMGNERALDAMEAVYANISPKAACNSDHLDEWGKVLPEGSDVQRGVAWASNLLRNARA